MRASRRGWSEVLTDVASRALQLSVHPNPRPQQSACPRGSVLLAVAAPIQPERTAEPSAAEQVAVRTSETAVRRAQDQRRSARNTDSRGAERVGGSRGGDGPRTH